MDKAFYQSILKTCIYERKQDTKGSFYYQSGDKLLPNRISITPSQVSKVQHKGRNLLHPVMGQMLGDFSKADESPYKQNKPFTIRTQMWQQEGIPILMWGTLGISGEDGRVTDRSDTGDLIVFVPDQLVEWRRMKIYILPSCGKSPADIRAALMFCLKLGVTF